MTMAGVVEETFQGTPRFELRRRLGAGAFGVVYEAFDRERNSLVALKTLRRTSDEALYRLKQEFRSLADIAHPNLAALYELFSDGRQWFFTMELVDGKTFHDYVLDEGGPPVPSSHPEARDSARDTATLAMPVDARPPALAPPPASGLRKGRFHLARLRSSLRQAAVGIHALHRAGKLHRDIKSSNVLVTRSDRVVLLDFGLVTELGLPEGTDETLEVAGTPTYMSPEQGTGGPISASSDWYSLGVMLYEALTGRPPFGGSTAAMMRDKQLREPRPPRDFVSGVPEDLERLCCALLHRDPKERPDGEEILRRLGGEAGDWALSQPIAATRKSPFVGRTREFARLREAFHEAETGRAVAVAVHGASGMGKTVLVRHFLDELHSDERVVILAGRCFEREAVPYKALDSLMDGLSRHLKRLPDARA
jgi:serine/threonine protein kinase